MMIEVTPATVRGVGSTFTTRLGAPLVAGAGAAGSAGSIVAAAAGDPGLAQAAAEFGAAARAALRSGAAIADGLGQALVKGADAYVATDNQVL